MISSTSMTSTIGVTFGVDATPPSGPPVEIAIEFTSSTGCDYCEIGPPLEAALNSRVNRERPNSPETPLMRYAIISFDTYVISAVRLSLLAVYDMYTHT